MLVYCSSLILQPENGPADVMACVAQWISSKVHIPVNPDRLKAGIREFRLGDAGIVSSKGTDVDGGISFPFFHSTRFSHRDSIVAGRRWVTEVGIRQLELGAQVDCSILLKTEEVGVFAGAPVLPTRPKLVELLIQRCRPIASTPGLKVMSLEDDIAAGFRAEVDRIDRPFPFVLLSARNDGTYPVDPERVRSLLVGLAEVVAISPDADTFRINRVVGQGYGAWGGAVNIIFPKRNSRSLAGCDNLIYTPAKQEELIQKFGAFDTAILATVTYRSNLPNSWKHVSIETVSQHCLQMELVRAVEGAKNGDRTAELLREASGEIQSKDEEILDLRIDVEGKDEEICSLKYKIDGLQQNLSNLKEARAGNVPSTVSADVARPFLQAVADGRLTLLQVLQIVAEVFKDQLVILDSALDSARASDSAGFVDRERVLWLLCRLADTYWGLLVSGKTEKDACAVFGRNYATHESGNLSAEGRRRRTFTYQDRDVFMERHLKMGVADNPAETLRIHFKWFAEGQKVVVGYCGAHLPL